MAKTMFLFLLTCPAILLATPIASDPAAVAADPAAAAVPVAAASPAVEQAVAAPPPAAAPVADVVDPAAGTKNLGTGYVTETKNPDGSTITITRYNGPLPASALAPFSAGLTGLHSSLYDNLYQTQIIQYQAQQEILRNLQQSLSYNYNPYLSLPSVLPFYRSSPFISYASGPFFSPFFGGYGGGYPFYPGGYGHQPYGKAA